MITVIAHYTAAAGAVRELLARHAPCDATCDMLTLAVEIDLKELT
jgi:hypothetical protein